jgi:hypothetical protein
MADDLKSYPPDAATQPAPRFKTATHVAAAALGTLIAFSVTPAGTALVKQYPYLTGVVALASTLASLYHVPVKGNQS